MHYHSQARPVRAASLLCLAAFAAGCAAQTWYPPPPVAYAPPAAPGAQYSMPAPAALNAPQLEQLLAPIALYPDPLLANVLTAATYPNDVADAAQWLREPGNADLAGDALSNALRTLPWDASVKSLLPFPEVLRLLSDNRAWTEQLGGAFVAQQAQVMDAVQTLRQRASQSGNLRSTPQAYVQTQGQTIIIEPPTPQYVYVPVYDPRVVYGPWPYSDYPPRYFSGYFTGATYFGTGVGIGWFGIAFEQERWRWNRWDWGTRRLVVYRDRYERYGHHHDHHFDDGYWRHDPDRRGHRDGDRYRDGRNAPRDGDRDGRKPPRDDVRDGRKPPLELNRDADRVRDERRGSDRGPQPGPRADRAPSAEGVGDRGSRGGRDRAPEARGERAVRPTAPPLPTPYAPPTTNQRPAAPSRWPEGSVPAAVMNRERNAVEAPALRPAPSRPRVPQATPEMRAPVLPERPPAASVPQTIQQLRVPSSDRLQAPRLEDRRAAEPRMPPQLERPVPLSIPQMREVPGPRNMPQPRERALMPERAERMQPRQFERERGPARQERRERQERRDDDRRERH